MITEQQRNTGSQSGPDDRKIPADDHVLASHAMDFLGSGTRRLDLHWHLLPDSCWSYVDDGLWDRAAVDRVGEFAVRVLDPTDQLLHICAHGPRWEPVPPIRWIADAEAVLARSDGGIDWDRLVEEAAAHRVTLPVLDALSYLRETFGLPIPAQTLEQLRQVPVRASERWAYRLRTRPATRLFGRFPEHWLRYRSLRRGWEAERRIGFVRYLEIVLGCDGAWTLAHRALFRERWRRQSRDLMEEYARQFHPAVPP